MSTKHQIIEPINGICKIALLQFKNEYTKISLRGFSIHYDDGNNTTSYIQQIINRTSRGDSHEDIAVLEKMIVDYLDWYVINNSDEISRKKFIQMIKMSLNGFRQLQLKTYKIGGKKSNVKLALQYYINLITIVTTDPDKYKLRDEFNMLLIADDTVVESNDMDELKDKDATSNDNNNNKLYTKLVNVDGLKNLWRKEEVDKLHSELTSCFDEHTLNKKTDDFTQAKVKCLIEILEKKDTQFRDEITKLLGQQF